MYKMLCRLRGSGSVVDAEGDQDNLFIPCSGRVFSEEDKSMRAPSPFFLSVLDKQNLHTNICSGCLKEKFWLCLWFTVKQFISKLRGKLSKTAKTITFLFEKHSKYWGFSPNIVIPDYLGWIEEFQRIFTEKKKKNHNQS